MFHFYEKDPHSGAGNCVCGAARENSRHPHEFTRSRLDPRRCICRQPRDSVVHLSATEMVGA
jgi:hypothetical protein